MSENDEERLLHEICRNSSMGREAIHEVLKDVYDEEFAYELHVQEGKMQEFEQRARQRLRQSGKDGSPDVRDAESSSQDENGCVWPDIPGGGNDPQRKSARYRGAEKGDP